jgi:soluble lytic murein transglycosylase-like protein
MIPDVCAAWVEQVYEVPAPLVQAIASVEAGGPGIVHRNRNGTEDLGWMQINSSWLPVLSGYGYTRDLLLRDPCANAIAGAWILRRYYARFADWTLAIRAYNVGPDLSGGYDYARRVILRWRGFYFQSQRKE